MPRAQGPKPAPAVSAFPTSIWVMRRSGACTGQKIAPRQLLLRFSTSCIPAVVSFLHSPHPCGLCARTALRRYAYAPEPKEAQERRLYRMSERELMNGFRVQSKRVFARGHCAGQRAVARLFRLTLCPLIIALQAVIDLSPTAGEITVAPISYPLT